MCEVQIAWLVGRCKIYLEKKRKKYSTLEKFGECVATVRKAEREMDCLP